MSEASAPILGVLFDAGNTLLRVRGSVGTVYAEVASRNGVRADAAALEEGFRRVFANRRSSFVGAVSRPHSPEREKAWWRSLVADVFREVELWTGLEPVFESYFEEVYETFAGVERWEIFPDVHPCLAALEARGIPLGVVSNWDSRLHGLLRELGLAERFRCVLTSAEFGAEKPHPSIFTAGASCLGVPAGQVLHVGDLIADDLRGARAAGLQAVLIDREGTAPPGIPAVRRLGDLEGALDGLKPEARS